MSITTTNDKPEDDPWLPSERANFSRELPSSRPKPRVGGLVSDRTVHHILPSDIKEAEEAEKRKRGEI